MTRSASFRRYRLGVVLALILLTGCTTFSGRRTEYRYDPTYGVDSPEFRRSLEAFGTKLIGGNTVDLLENGDRIFPAMIDAIRSAQESVNMEMFIFTDDSIGRSVAEALRERARAGVEVRLLVDDLGSHLGNLEDELEQDGVQVEIYAPLHWVLLYRLGMRTHRKILTVDGRIGFCGGVGIDDRWKGDARNENEWRETMVRTEGPVVSQLQAIFMEDWLQTTGEVIHGPKQFPPQPPVGDILAQAVASSQYDGHSQAKLLFYMAFQAARKRIWLENAYFIPDRQIRQALIAAARRGVDVKVIVPGRHIDIPAIRMASQFHYGQLLEGGVEIYEYLPTMNHNKVVVVDGVWTTIGTVNFDSRSMMNNAEVSLAMYDHGVAERTEAMIRRDLEKSERFTIKEWRRRGFAAHFVETFFWFLSETL